MDALHPFFLYNQDKKHVFHKPFAEKPAFIQD